MEYQISSRASSRLGSMLARLRMEKSEALARRWAAEHLGEFVESSGPASAWVPAGWELHEEGIDQIRGAVDNDAAPLRLSVTAWDSTWAWEIEEDYGQGDWGPIDVARSWDDTHHDESGDYTGTATTLAGAAAAAWAASERRQAWWLVEVEIIRGDE